MSIIQAHVLISGKVQGVFFRSNTEDKVKELGLNGWVKNLPDGRVEAVFEGEEKVVNEMVEWCKKGPRFSHVRRIDVEFDKASNEFHNFEIRY